MNAIQMARNVSDGQPRRGWQVSWDVLPLGRSTHFVQDLYRSPMRLRMRAVSQRLESAMLLAIRQEKVVVQSLADWGSVVLATRRVVETSAAPQGSPVVGASAAQAIVAVTHAVRQAFPAVVKHAVIYCRQQASPHQSRQ
jgi:hypothetical protein